MAHQLTYNGQTIRERADMLCLTDMWKAAGSPPSKRPSHWARLPQAVEFISKTLENVGKSDVWAQRSGRGGGVWAHWQIGMAYAQYLSTDFHQWCNAVVRAHMEQKPAPDTARAALRAETIQTRKDYASAAMAREVTRQGMSRATNAGYIGCFGKDTAALRRELGVKGKKTPRDKMSRVQLAQVRLYEELSVEDFDALNARGDDQCAAITANNARHVANAVSDARSNRGIA